MVLNSGNCFLVARYVIRRMLRASRLASVLLSDSYICLILLHLGSHLFIQNVINYLLFGM